MKPSFKNNVLAGICMAALAASIAPALAFAEAGSRFTSDITVNGVTNGDTVTAYELVDSIVGDDNNKTTVTNLTDYPSTDSELASYVENYPISYLIGQAIASASITASGSSVTFEDLDDGAWLIVVTNGTEDARVYKNTVVNNDTQIINGSYAANPQTVDVKSTDTNVNKTIDGQSFQQGQSYDFTVTFAVPSFPANATDKTLTVKDTPTGFTDDASSIVIKAGDSTLAKGTDYNVTANDDGGFTISFAEDYISANPNQQLTVTYTATLTDVAATNGTASNHITVNDDDAKVTVNTYGIYFKKIDANGNALPGATFTLYEATEDGQADTSKVYGTSTSGDDGYIYFSGLAQGKTYVAVETTVPSGKQKVEDVIITIDSASATKDNPATSEVEEDNYQQSSDLTDPDQGILPQTGGAGTLGITAVGVVLIAGGAIAAVRSRKKSE